MTHLCRACGEEFTDIGTHWRYNSDHREDIDDTTKQILEGAIMGDGSVQRGGDHCGIRVAMKNKRAIQYLSNEISIPNSVVKDKNQCRNGEIFRLITARHPDFNEYGNWYKEEGKVWPEIPLTPLRLKWLYVSDGHLNTTRSNFFIEISVKKERENKDKLESMLEYSGLEVSNWNQGKMTLSTADTKKALEYMGDPVPGFEYKWGK